MVAILKRRCHSSCHPFADLSVLLPPSVNVLVMAVCERNPDCTRFTCQLGKETGGKNVAPVDLFSLKAMQTWRWCKLMRKLGMWSAPFLDADLKSVLCHPPYPQRLRLEYGEGKLILELQLLTRTSQRLMVVNWWFSVYLGLHPPLPPCFVLLLIL